MTNTKIAFVTPWYGPGAPGGAEAQTRLTAERFAKIGLPVEVLTTCIRDFYGDWGKNHFRQGLSVIKGVTVRRFRVQSRNRKKFDELNWRLLNNLPLTPEEEQIFIGQMIIAPGLYKYIKKHADKYLFLFIPYMFSTTYFGAQIAPERSLLIPCLHDESYARLDVYKQLIPQLRALIFFTQAEADLAESLYGQNSRQLRPVVGGGFDTNWSADGERFLQKFELEGPLVLYAGRRESGKNVDLLIEYWRRYRQRSSNEAKLILIGPGDIRNQVLATDEIIDLGFLPVQDKYDAFAAADIFCNPSVHESFSRSLMESWLARTPAIVHSDCAVTREHCQMSNGGLYFRDFEEFAAAIDYLLDNKTVGDLMGQQGRRYVLNNFTWDIVIERYKALFEKVLQE